MKIGLGKNSQKSTYLPFFDNSGNCSMLAAFGIAYGSEIKIIIQIPTHLLQF